MGRKSVKQCEERLHDEPQVAALERPGDAAIPAAGSGSRLRMPVGFISVAAVVMTPRTIPSNPGCCRGDGREGRLCGRGRTCPGRGAGSVCFPIHLGRILPWILAGEFGLRLLGCPGRRGQGSRPEAPRHDSRSLRWKSAFSSPRQPPKLPDVLCARRGSGFCRAEPVVAQVGLMCEGVFSNDPKTQPGRSRTLPAHLIVISCMDFLPLLIFPLKNGFPTSWPGCPSEGTLSHQGCCPGDQQGWVEIPWQFRAHRLVVMGCRRAPRAFRVAGRAVCGILQRDEQGILPPVGALGVLG